MFENTGRRTEHVEVGVNEEISVNVAGVALKNVNVVTKNVRVFDVVSADLTTCSTTPLCAQSPHQQPHYSTVLQWNSHVVAQCSQHAY